MSPTARVIGKVFKFTTIANCTLIRSCYHYFRHSLVLCSDIWYRWHNKVNVRRRRLSYKLSDSIRWFIILLTLDHFDIRLGWFKYHNSATIISPLVMSQQEILVNRFQLKQTLKQKHIQFVFVKHLSCKMSNKFVFTTYKFYPKTISHISAADVREE